MEKSLNWLVFSQALLIRSMNEFVKFKRMERSMIQLQNLVDQFNDSLPSSSVRCEYVFALNYPNYYDLQRKLADFYMKIGSVMSSCEIYSRLGMEEESVECLYLAGHKDRAKLKAEEMFEANFQTPKLLCIYGDIMSDFTYYKKAWKTSNKRFVRAARLLGKYYYY